MRLKAVYCEQKRGVLGMELGKRINELRKAKGISIEELCALSGVPKGTLSKITAGITPNPTLDTVKAIARALGCRLDDFDDPDETQKSPVLSDEAQRLARDYEVLDGHGQKTVRAVADLELDRVKTAASTIIDIEEARKKTVPLLGGSFAAGRAEPDFGNVWTDYEIDADSPAEFAIHIHGDSMEPHLKDGSIALGVKREPQDGEVGAFMLNGEFLVKQYCEDSFGNVYLFSLNRERADADLTLWAKDRDNNELVCFGTIITKKRFRLPM